jgi:antitoxin CcdA
MNLTVSGELADAARELGVNASQAAEAGIAAAVRRAREEAWLEANRGAIDEHAAWLDRHGVPLEPAWPE